MIAPMRASGQADLDVSRWREVVRIGGVDVAPEAAFIREPALIVDREGRIFARPLAEAAEVRVFSPEGEPEVVIGGEGEGPGEFRTVSGHGFVGDSLWVRDWGTRRISWFDPGGTLLRTEPVDRRTFSDAPVQQGQTVPLAGGRVLSLAREYPPGAEGWVDAPVVLASRTLDAPVTIARTLLPFGMLIDGVGWFAYQPIPFGPLVAASPWGTSVVVVSWRSEASGEVSVRRFAPDGRVTLDRRLEFPPVAVPAEAVDSLVTRGIGMAQQQFRVTERAGGSVPDDVEEAVRKGLNLPAFFPPIQQVVVGVDDTIWLRRMTGLTSGDWVVLSPDGAELFRIAHPGITVWQASREAVWGTTLGALDIPYIVRLDIIRDPA